MCCASFRLTEPEALSLSPPLALGLLILRVLRMLPYVGWFTGLLVVLLGLGAIVLAIHRRLAPPAALAAA